MRYAIVILRILAGAGMTAAGVMKLLDPGFLYGGLMHKLAEVGEPFGFYREMLLGRYVEFHQTTFAYAVAIGEVLVGLCLLAGLLVSLASLGGIFLMVNFALAVSAGNPVSLAAHLVFIGIFALLGRTAAGLTWGLDGWLAEHIKEAIILFPFRLSRPSE
jgi:thiosulfate dehydrogenase (quinone) large subunit